MNYGVDVNTGGIADSFANFVWEPSVVKVQDFFVILKSVFLQKLNCFDGCRLAVLMSAFFFCRLMQLMLQPKLLVSF